jgi:protein phosphatase
MGIAAILPRPCLSTVVERKSGYGFHVGVAEINGWRPKMEDAHVIFIKKDWAFFGVFDGHGGDEASKFVSEQFYERLEAQGCPATDADIKKMCLDIDKDFLDTKKSSGTTGAMCIVHRGTGGKMRLRVANAGDSRVFLGRRDGTIVDGGGTEQGLSTDHKPDHPKERERIERCGGCVVMPENDMGCARVNGDLAVSRGFGDADFKKFGPAPEDHPVIADPELQEFSCDITDFVVIACDGVSEGDFPNPEVVKLIAAELQSAKPEGASTKGGIAARAVCLKAEEQNSKDNITCMVIQFSDDTTALPEKSLEHIPGPLAAISEKNFMQVYENMAERGGVTLQEAVEKRYRDITEAPGAQDDPKLVKEAESIGEPKGEVGSEERANWFKTVQEKYDGSQQTPSGSRDYGYPGRRSIIPTTDESAYI